MKPNVARFCIYNEEGKLSVRPAADGYWCQHDDFARLSAERDLLLARLEETTVDCEANRHEREVVCANYEVLKAEMSKARELLNSLQGASIEMLRVAAIAKQGSNSYNRAIVNLHEKVVSAALHKSAPDAKP